MTWPEAGDVLVLRARAEAVWRKNPHLEILGLQGPRALPIFSFRVRDGQGGLVHHQFFTRLLSDVYGIQARGGCACAGPYGHRLLGIEQPQSDALRAGIATGRLTEKPGWVRLALHYMMDEDEVLQIVDAVNTLSYTWRDHLHHYEAPPLPGCMAG